MMEAVREYLISIVAACMLSVAACAMVRQPLVQKAVRLIGGLLVLFVVAAPLVRLDFAALTEKLTISDGGFDAQTAQEERHEAWKKHIKQTAEQYISDKAAELGATLRVTVEVSDDEIPVPVGVTLAGTANLAQRAQLEQYLAQELNINAEGQEWKLYE